jgi:hypothetical protein
MSKDAIEALENLVERARLDLPGDDEDAARARTLLTELKEYRDQGMPAFSVQPTPGHCRACGRPLP